MMKNNDLVSVVIPCYNSEDFISQTINSVIEQTYSNYEIIVVDDGSTDRSLELIKKYKSQITIYESTNKGACHARNLGASKAKGEFIIFLDSDDLFSINTLEVLVENISKKNPISMCIWHRLKLINGDWKIIKSIIENKPPKNDFILGWLSGWYIPTSGVLWSKNLFFNIGMFDETISANQDGDLMLRALISGYIPSLTNDTNILYRHHSDNKLSISNTKSIRNLKSRIFVLQKIIENLKRNNLLEKYRVQIGRLYHNLARNHYGIDADIANQCEEEAKKLASIKRLNGTTFHVFFTIILGLKLKEKIAFFISKLFNINSKRLISNNLQKLSRNKKIAFLILKDVKMFPPTINAASILSDKNFEVDIYSLRYNKGNDLIEIPKNVNLIYLGDLKKGIGYRLIYFSVLIKFIGICIKNKYDWIFCYNMPAVFPGYIASRFSNSKLYYHVHDDTLPKANFSFHYLLKKIEIIFAKKFDIISYPQIQRAQNFQKLANLKSLPYIVKNGPLLDWSDIDSSNNPFEYLKNKYQNIIIYQGGLNWQRGIKTMLDIHSKLDKQIGLVLIGKIDHSESFVTELNAYIKKNKIVEQVEIFTNISYNKLPMLTKLCDLGYGVIDDSSSSYNIKLLAGASNKLVEYMSCAIPSIVVNNNAYKKYIEDRNIGILIDPNDISSSANKISKLLLDNNRFEKMRENCKIIFKDEECFNSQFKKILNKL